MFLSVSTTYRPATDLGFLVHKNPERIHVAELAFGKARLFYPEAGPDRCELALVLDLDPVAIVRGGAGKAGPVDHYVNDRPYVASSFLAVAIGRTLREAMAGRSRERPELAATAIPLEATLGPVPLRDDAFAHALFEPLGYAVSVERHPLDATRPDWGEGPYATLRLSGVARLSDLLTHICVLIPAMDGQRKHYWVGEDEVAKLLARGESWLPSHPARAAIVSGYLDRHRDLVREADEAMGVVRERPVQGLNEMRHAAVVHAIVRSGARRVLDLGCGEGRLLARLLADPSVAEAVGVDASRRALSRAEAALERLPQAQAARGRLIHGGLTYRDARLAGFDAAALVEVIEHVDPDRLDALERCVFAHARPATVVVTTPNAEHNAAYGMAPGERRHGDHRFELDRAGFEAWCVRVGGEHGYAHAVTGVGDPHPDHGSPTQMATFTRIEEAA